SFFLMARQPAKPAAKITPVTATPCQRASESVPSCQNITCSREEVSPRKTRKLVPAEAIALIAIPVRTSVRTAAFPPARAKVHTVSVASRAPAKAASGNNHGLTEERPKSDATDAPR